MTIGMISVRTLENKRVRTDSKLWISFRLVFICRQWGWQESSSAGSVSRRFVSSTSKVHLKLKQRSVLDGRHSFTEDNNPNMSLT